MGNVIYSMGVSLDGFIAGPSGEIDWAAPDEDLHRFINQQMQTLGAHLCGRRLYETMVYWETARSKGLCTTEYEFQFARIWCQLPKVVFSKNLARVEGNSRLAAGGVVEELSSVRDNSKKDIAVGGAGLASALIKLNLIDEFRLFVSPVMLGGGTPFFPALDARVPLKLIESRSFGSGALYLCYRRI